MGRNGIGIEILPNYFELARQEIQPDIEIEPFQQMALLEKKKKYESTEPE